MPTFLLSYRLAKDYTPGNPEALPPWRAYFAGMGESVLDAGNPIFARAGIGEVASDATVLGGYSFITADNLEQALALVETCPVLANGGGVEVGEITPVNPVPTTDGLG